MGRVLVNSDDQIPEIPVVKYYCPLCGNDVLDTDETCPHCSAKFVPISLNSISEEEKRVIETQEKIKAIIDAEKEKSKKETVCSSLSSVKEVTKKVEKKYTPRTGTRIAFVYEELKNGINFNELVTKLVDAFDLQKDAALQNAKGIIAELQNYRKLNITNLNDFYKLVD